MKYLIVVDVQEDFTTGVLGTPEANAMVGPLSEYVQEKLMGEDTKVYYTQDTHFPNTYPNSLEGQHFPIHCVAGTSGWDLDERIRYPWARSYQKEGFGATWLLDHLRNECQMEEPEEFEVVGLVTEVCVLSMCVLLRSYFKNTRIVVQERFTEGVTPQKKQEALSVLESLLIEVKRNV